MPAYDLSLILKSGLQRPQLAEAVKRAALEILDRGGIVRKIEFLGERQLPAKKEIDEVTHTKGNYFILKLDCTTLDIVNINEAYGRDNNILQRNFVGMEKKFVPVCTLTEELKPPSERPSVQRMIAIGRQRPKYARIFEPRTGLDYYPFHK